jgi:hypothetical protein
MLELKELEKYAIESGTIFTVSDTEFTLRTREKQTVIDLCVCKEDDRYKCLGGIFLHDEHVQLELVNVSKTVKTEREIIFLFQSMINASRDVLYVIINRRIHSQSSKY